MLEYLGTATSLIPILFYLLFLRKRNDKRVLVFFIYCIYSFVTDIAIFSLGAKGVLTDNTYNIILGLFTVIEFSTFCLFFYFTFENRLTKRIVFSLIPLFFIITVSSFIYKRENPNNLDNITLTFQAIIFMALCLSFLFSQIKSPTSFFIYTTFEFWVVTGILIYLSGTFFIYLLSASLTREEINDFWFINTIFNIQRNIFITLGFYFYKSQKKYDQDSEIFKYQLDTNNN